MLLLFSDHKNNTYPLQVIWKIQRYKEENKNYKDINVVDINIIKIFMYFNPCK